MFEIKFRSLFIGVLMFCAFFTHSSALPPPGIPDAANSFASSAAGCIEIAPDGGRKSLGEAGLTITVTLRDELGFPVIGYPAIWLAGAAANTQVDLCSPPFRLTASAPTNLAGVTVIDGVFSGGGQNRANGSTLVSSGLQVYAGGVPIASPPLPIWTASADMITRTSTSTSG